MQKIDLIELYTEVLGEKIKDYNLPPPSFEIMQCEIVKYNEDEKLIIIKPITMDVEFIYVTATLFEQKKKRLIFDVIIKDIDEIIYTKAKVTNWII